MSNYIPVYPHYDRMPVDISFVFKDEMPAGKHGFCKVQGEHFAFEDGTRATFWGVIMNGASNFPDHDYAEKCADRLMQSGVNYVRFHQLDSEWATPNLYRHSAGQRVATTRNLDEISMEKMDYWIKCLKERGIYIGTDVTTYRKFKSGDGVKCAKQLTLNPKGYALFDPLMIDLQKEFAVKFWNHYNPYTGLCYKDDPVFAFVDIINENDLFKSPFNSMGFNRVEYYDNEFLEFFAAWLKEKGITDYDISQCKLYDEKDSVQTEFRIHLMKTFCEGMYAHLREIGVKVPICGTNWAHSCATSVAQRTMDFQDGHTYFYDWGWGEHEKATGNATLTTQAASPLASSASLGLAGQPMIMTEWDMPWSNSYRAEGPIWFPAVAAFQGWSAMSIHTYGYAPNHRDTDLLGKEAATDTLGGVPYREGIFTVWNDPAKFGLFYHGALMMRRGDVSEGRKTIGAKFNMDKIGKVQKELTGTAMEMHRVKMLLEDSDTSKVDEILPADQKYAEMPSDIIVSDTGELWRNRKKKRGAVDSPRTKAVYGFLGINNVRARNYDPTIKLNGLTVRCNTDFAVIAMSSLTDEPIETSDNILLTTVGRACNTDAWFDGEKLLDIGKLPIQMEVIDAEIELKTDKENMVVMAVDSDGFYSGEVESTWENGVLKFHLGPHCACQYYLIREE